MSRKIFSNIWKRPEDSYTRPSIYLERTDSIDSNATAPNIPGPGRNVGRLYDVLGSKFEDFLRRKGPRLGLGQSGPQLSLQLFRKDSIDSIASDATAPNNPGPGRNLGRLYDALGARLEVVVHKRTGRLNQGPDVVVQDIHELRCYRRKPYFGKNGDLLSIPVVDNSVSPTEKQYRILRKLCRKLLKYCRSHELEIQLRALDEVTTLAVGDPHVRKVFESILKSKYLIPKYEERELHLSCHKAIVSIKEAEIHNIWSQNVSSDGAETRLARYLCDPDVSFLVARLLRKEYDDAANVLPSQWMWDCYVDVAVAQPQIIEWDSLNAFFKYQFHGCPEFIRNHASQILRLACQIPDFSLYDNNQALLFKHPNHASMDLIDLEYRAERIRTCLNFLTGLEDLVGQLQYLRHLDRETRSYLQASVFGNEVLIAYIRIYCNRNVIHCIYGPKSCLPELSVMLYYYLNGVPDEKNLAKVVLLRSIGSSRYLKYALSYLLTQHNPISQLLNPPQLIEQQWCFMNRRWMSKSKHKLKLAGEGENMHKNDTLCLYESLQDSLWLQVFGDERPFVSKGHFPVLAGYDLSGRELYIARAWDGETPYHMYTYVSNGESSISFINDDGKWITTSRFFVLVLKHDPCDVGVPVIPDNAKFQTGSVYWIQTDDDDTESETDSDTESDHDSDDAEQRAAVLDREETPSNFVPETPQLEGGIGE
ncbi:hypothetical protein SCHPADRAFT_586305 [Schizopora paradoxa]|uniref:Uncharacterized protein n=1 Tax=Schizopora paradoxa TaxID=27342 RepID=A0A0H2RHL4_9AGAM|nr:hypothetical protein SCHPADRAFT_586305 [Schizopora paradoxa]